MFVGVSSTSSFRALLFSLVLSFQLIVAASAVIDAPIATSEQRREVLNVPLKRNNIWERADRSPEENLEAQTNHIKGKYRQNFIAYHENTGHNSPQMNPNVSIASLQERALEEHQEAVAHKRRSEKHRRSKLHSRAAAKVSIALKPTDNYVLWQGNLRIGTPGQTVKVSFDTGSADFVLNMDQYEASKSSSGKNTKNKFAVYYADGTGESGYVYNETVRIGTSIAKHQAVGIPTYSTFGADEPGLVGMAFQSIAAMNRRPLVQTLFAQGSIPKAMFGVALSRDQTNAEMQLGGFRRSKIAAGESLQWRKADTSGGFWVLKNIGVTISREVNGKDSTGTVLAKSAIMDTGTTLIYGPTADVKALYKAANITTRVHSGSVYGIYKKTPDVKFTVNGKDYPMTDSAVTFTKLGDYKYGSIIGNDDLGLAEGQWLIGDPWFSSLYTVFDIDQTRVGFAAASY